MKGHLYRNPGRKIWMLAYYGPRPDGRRGQIRESSRTDDEEKARKILEARLRGVRNHEDGIAEFKGPEARRITVGELFDDLMAFYRVNQIKGLSQAGYRLRARWVDDEGIEREGSPLQEYFGHRRVAEVTPKLMANYILARREEGRQNSTINRDLELLRRAFNVAVDPNRRLVKSLVPTFPKKLPENVRTETISPAEHETLLEHLPKPLDDVARFGFLTGWRRGQVLGIRWEWVDLEARELSMPGAKTKSGKAHTIPLDDDLLAIMRRQRARGVGSEWVFHRRGKPISRSVFKKQWAAARIDAKLPSKHFHDYRRSMASEQRRSGTPEGVIMKLGGWTTRSVFDRYDIKNTDDMREALARRKSYAAK